MLKMSRKLRMAKSSMFLRSLSLPKLSTSNPWIWGLVNSHPNRFEYSHGEHAKVFARSYAERSEANDNLNSEDSNQLEKVSTLKKGRSPAVEGGAVAARRGPPVTRPPTPPHNPKGDKK